jgi:hypothetical protein
VVKKLPERGRRSRHPVSGRKGKILPPRHEDTKEHEEELKNCFVFARTRPVIILLLLAGLMLLAGCCPTPRPPYTGPTDPMVKVVADINSNNAKVPTLWAHHYYSADIVDQKHQSHHVGGDGVLMFIAPMSMRLKGDNGIIGTVFELGSNPQTFWLKLSPDTGDTMWWGSWANLPLINPDTLGIPIRPDMVLDVLCIATINTNFNVLPVPTMRFNNAASEDNPGGAYVFIWNAKLPDHWYAAREVWYDRITKLPTLVLLYDTNGRVVMRADFKAGENRKNEYRQVSIAGLPKAQWPYVPGRYRFYFPDSGSRLSFSLDEAELKHKSEDDLLLPDPRSFRMPDPNNVNVKNVIEVGKQPGE